MPACWAGNLCLLVKRRSDPADKPRTCKFSWFRTQLPSLSQLLPWLRLAHVVATTRIPHELVSRVLRQSLSLVHDTTWPAQDIVLLLLLRWSPAARLTVCSIRNLVPTSLRPRSALWTGRVCWVWFCFRDLGSTGRGNELSPCVQDKMDLISMVDSLEAGLPGFFTRHFWCITSSEKK